MGIFLLVFGGCFLWGMGRGDFWYEMIVVGYGWGNEAV